MRDALFATLFVCLMAVMWFPQSGGYVAHKIFNDLKIGWESVK